MKHYAPLGRPPLAEPAPGPELVQPLIIGPQVQPTGYAAHAAFAQAIAAALPLEEPEELEELEEPEEQLPLPALHDPEPLPPPNKAVNSLNNTSELVL